MNLSPRRDLIRPVAARAFADDRLPTAFAYPITRQGVSAAVGYRPTNAANRLPDYELNQTNALGSYRGDGSVSATLGYKF